MIFHPAGIVYEDVSNPLWDDDGLWRISKQLYSTIKWNEVRKEYNLDKFIFHEPTKTSYIFDEEKRRLISIEEPKSIETKVYSLFFLIYGLFLFSIKHFLFCNGVVDSIIGQILAFTKS